MLHGIFWPLMFFPFFSLSSLLVFTLLWWFYFHLKTKILFTLKLIAEFSLFYFIYFFYLSFHIHTGREIFTFNGDCNYRIRASSKASTPTCLINNIILTFLTPNIWILKPRTTQDLTLEFRIITVFSFYLRLLFLFYF